MLHRFRISALLLCIILIAGLVGCAAEGSDLAQEQPTYEPLPIVEQEPKAKELSSSEIIPSTEPESIPLPASSHPLYSWVVPPIYDDIPAFSGNFARIVYGGVNGVVDMITGDVVLPPTYDFIAVGPERRYFTRASLGNQWGVIDLTGQVLLPFVYGYAFFLDNFNLVISSERRGNGQPSTVSVVEMPSGRIIVPPGLYDNIRSNNRDEFAIVIHRDGSRDLYGFINITTGEEIVPPAFSSAQHFSEDLAAVALPGDKWGFIDRTGQVVVSFDYEDVCSRGFNNGVVAVRRDGRWGVIDTSGAYVLPPTYAWLALDNAMGEFVVAMAQNSDSGRHYTGVLNMQTGEEVVPAVFSDGAIVSDNIAVMAEYGWITWPDSPLTLIDLITGEEITSFSYGLQNVHRSPWPYRFRGGTIVVHERRDEWTFYGLMDTQGKLILPLIFDDIGYFCDNLLIVQNSCGRFGLVDNTSRELLPPIYSFVQTEWTRMGHDLAAISYGGEWVDQGESDYIFTGGLWGFINMQGQIVIPAELDFAQARSAGHSMAAVQTNDGLWGIIRVHTEDY